MVLNTGRYFGMRRLYDECSDASDEDRRVSKDSPRHRVWSEEARFTSVVERVCQGHGPVGEQRTHCSDHTILNASSEVHTLECAFGEGVQDGFDSFEDRWQTTEAAPSTQLDPLFDHGLRIDPCGEAEVAKNPSSTVRS